MKRAHFKKGEFGYLRTFLWPDAEDENILRKNVFWRFVFPIARTKPRLGKMSSS